LTPPLVFDQEETELKVIASGLGFPEGPVYLKDGSILFVEIAEGRVCRVNAAGEVSVVAHTGGGPNGLAIGPDGAAYLCNNGGLVFRESGGVRKVVHGVLPEDYKTGSIQRIDLATGEVKTLYTHCGEWPLCGPNDLVFDEHGGFYFTDFGKTRARDRDIGSVYYAKPDGSFIEEIIHPIANPNGVGISPDQKTLYVTETETSRLWAYPIVGPGKVELAGQPSPNGGRLICGLPGYQRFDSLKVQANGDICVGTLITGHITVISPDGRRVSQVKTPDTHATNLCFGGPDLKTAYVTQSIEGKIIQLDWPEAGLPLHFN
jgi:gluconolactonase